MSKQQTEHYWGNPIHRMWDIVEEDTREYLSKNSNTKVWYSDYSCKKLMARAGYTVDCIQGFFTHSEFRNINNFSYLCMLVYYHYTDESGNEMQSNIKMLPKYRLEDNDLETLGSFSIPDDLCIRFNFGKNHLDPLYVAVDTPSGRAWMKGNRIDWYVLDKLERQREDEYLRSLSCEWDRESYYEACRERDMDTAEALGLEYEEDWY